MEPRTLLSAGDLDATLSGDGMLTTDFGGPDAAGAVVLLSDGKMLVAGTGGGPQEDLAVARSTTGGSLDRTFGSGDGKAVGNIASGDREFARVNDAALLPDGKFLLVGTLTIDETYPNELTGVRPRIGTGGRGSGPPSLTRAGWQLWRRLGLGEKAGEEVRTLDIQLGKTIGRPLRNAENTCISRRISRPASIA